MENYVTPINTREDWNQLSVKYGSLGGHEPGDRDPMIEARVVGYSYDDHTGSNFPSGRANDHPYAELKVIFYVGGKPVACCGLSTLVDFAQFPDWQGHR